MSQSRPILNLGSGRPASSLPLELADLHGSLATGECISCRLEPLLEEGWGSVRGVDLLAGAGFSIEGVPRTQGSAVCARAVRIRSLPDTVGPGMRLLIVGLNPSPYSADHGVAYARPGNRFWPAVLAAGIASIDRDPRHALRSHGLGMTDLVRRTTRRADQVDLSEFQAGFARVSRLVEWLCPKAVCFVGLGGWRAVVERKAQAGVQQRMLGGRPVYVMPHTSGLNAHSRLADLTAHLAAAATLADKS